MRKSEFKSLACVFNFDTFLVTGFQQQQNIRSVFSDSNATTTPTLSVLLNFLLTAFCLNCHCWQGILMWMTGKSRQRPVLALRRLLAIQLRPSYCCCWAYLVDTPDAEPYCITLHNNHAYKQMGLKYCHLKYCQWIGSISAFKRQFLVWRRRCHWWKSGWVSASID